MRSLDSYSDDDFRRTILRALRLLFVLTVLVGLGVWWRFGWKSALLLVVGSVISGSGLWEWLRLMTAIMVSMDAGGSPKAVVRVLTAFFLRLVLIVAVLYASLKTLEGSVFALAAGLALGIFCLMIEGLRLAKGMDGVTGR